MIDVHCCHRNRRFSKAETLRVVQRVLRGEHQQSADVTVVFVDHQRMTELNQQYLKHRGTTDTIAFALGTSSKIEGEAYVNLDQAAVQAKDYGVTYSDEVRRLIIHTILHLCGYRDKRPAEKKLMTQKEDFYLS